MPLLGRGVPAQTVTLLAGLMMEEERNEGEEDWMKMNLKLHTKGERAFIEQDLVHFLYDTATVAGHRAPFEVGWGLESFEHPECLFVWS